MKIPLLDLKREYASIAEEIARAWNGVLATMVLLNGTELADFEREMAEYLGVGAVCGVASGSDALRLTLLALGIGAGNEVILHANAFAADIEAIHHVGARARLVDVAASDLGPDPEQVEGAITPRTRAVLVVHMYGTPLALAPLLELAQRSDLTLIEDGSHAHGAVLDGHKVGSLGRVACFSAGVVKNLGAYGDAGFVATSDAALDHQLRLLQRHGQERKNQHSLLGFNSRLDELQAAVLRIKLRHLDARNQRRREIAAYYRGRWSGLDLRVLEPRPGSEAVYHQFVVRTPQRDRLADHLRAHGIETGIHYPVPLHRQPSWRRHHSEELLLPRAEALAAEILSLPVFPDLSDSEIDHVATTVRRFFC